MSGGILVYFAVAALSWAVCIIGVRDAAGPTRMDRLAAGTLAAIAWPFMVAVLAVYAVRKRQAARAQGFPAAVGGLVVLPVDAPRRQLVAVGG